MKPRLSLLAGGVALLWAASALAQERHDALARIGCLQRHGIGEVVTAPDLGSRLVPDYTLPPWRPRCGTTLPRCGPLPQPGSPGNRRRATPNGQTPFVTSTCCRSPRGRR